MKHLKTYNEANYEANEANNNKIQIGQYVIMSLESSISNNNDTIKQIHSFIKKNIGQIVAHSDNAYIIKYDDIPDYMNFLNDIIKDEYGENTIKIGYTHTENITHSSNKEELLPFINANKYNL